MILPHRAGRARRPSIVDNFSRGSNSSHSFISCFNKRRRCRHVPAIVRENGPAARRAANSTWTSVPSYLAMVLLSTSRGRYSRELQARAALPLFDGTHPKLLMECAIFVEGALHDSRVVDSVLACLSSCPIVSRLALEQVCISLRRGDLAQRKVSAHLIIILPLVDEALSSSRVFHLSY